MNAPEAAHAGTSEEGGKALAWCLCSPAQVGGILPVCCRQFSHTLQHVWWFLASSPTPCRSDYCKETQPAYSACLEPVEERNVVAFAVQGCSKWSGMGRGGAPHQPLLCCPPATACPCTHLLFAITWYQVQKVPQRGQTSL